MARVLVKTKQHSFPLHLYLGLCLALFFWTASWLHVGALGEYAFFPQWLGYVLTVDALVAWRRGSSLLTRSPALFVALFILSAPIWWVFEGLNEFVQNWHYLGAYSYTVGQIIAISTIDFSTVIPAVFETADLVSSFHFVERLGTRRRFRPSSRFLWGLMYLGAAAFAAVILLPRFAFPLTWVWLVLLVDPLNCLRGRRSLIGQIAQGDWRMLVSLAIAGTICGFFWEMWNWLAWPKWYYTVPFVGFGKVFEMPLLGYGGYWPFAWELYALYHLVGGVLHRPADALTLDREASPSRVTSE